MLPKKKGFIQEIKQHTPQQTPAPEFIQEVVEPEVSIPVEPEMLVEEEEVKENKVVITSERL